VGVQRHGLRRASAGPAADAFGEYSTHELGIQLEAYDPKLDVDFTALREQDLTTVGLGQAA
jgi:hypothetical protein